MIATVIYPLAAGAAAVNIFFASLLLQALNLSALSPISAVLAGAVAGIPFAFVAARWLRGLIDRAEDEAG
ncbi:MAG: hypothetical protein GY952_12280 [Rhodobacteraceae bacterium]|nr:hypothetical protein [Paracoccaceae bacterium]